MSDPLKRCPFCGGEPIKESLVADNGQPRYVVRCRSCACEGGWGKTETQGENWWNMRPGGVADAPIRVNDVGGRCATCRSYRPCSLSSPIFGWGKCLEERNRDLFVDDMPADFGCIFHEATP